jgi:F0F1-type ATP synthase membrane subunit c/vacuolar-type H+-ATPase subunit K
MVSLTIGLCTICFGICFGFSVGWAADTIAWKLNKEKNINYKYHLFPSFWEKVGMGLVFTFFSSFLLIIISIIGSAVAAGLGMIPPLQ